MNEPAPGPVALAAFRDAIWRGREPPPLHAVAAQRSYWWFVVGTVCIGAFMGQVDASITALILPRLEVEFAARLSTVSWVGVGYLLTMAAFLPIFGRLADMVGRKLLYIGGFLLFVLGSALCGLSPDLPALIAFRVLQGMGSALLSSNSIAIVMAAAGPERRGHALGITAAAQAIGLTAGPALGGFILDTLGWRWVFWINVPVGLIGAAIAWLVLPQTKNLPGGRFDWTGALFIVPALVALVGLLNEAQVWGLTSPLSIGCLLVATALLWCFIRSERRAESPLIDLKLFQRVTFVTGTLAGLIAYAALFGVLFLLPFIQVRVYHHSALEAGLRLSIVPLMLGLVAPIAGALYDRVGAPLLTVSGMLISAAALVLLFTALDGTASSVTTMTLGLALFGAGQGLFISPNNSAIMATTPERLTGEAGALLNVMRALGISVGIAAASSMLSWRLAVRTGLGQGTLHATPQELLAAGSDVLLTLAALAAVAGALSFVRGHSPPDGKRVVATD